MPRTSFPDNLWKSPLLVLWRHWCMQLRCIQWPQRTNFTAPGCILYLEGILTVPETLTMQIESTVLAMALIQSQCVLHHGAYQWSTLQAGWYSWSVVLHRDAINTCTGSCRHRCGDDHSAKFYLPGVLWHSLPAPATTRVCAVLLSVWQWVYLTLTLSLWAQVWRTEENDEGQAGRGRCRPGCSRLLWRCRRDDGEHLNIVVLRQEEGGSEERCVREGFRWTLCEEGVMNGEIF